MTRPKTKHNAVDDGELVLFTTRLKPSTVEIIRQRAAADRRPPSQWLRNLIEDALHTPKAVVK